MNDGRRPAGRGRVRAIGLRASVNGHCRRRQVLSERWSVIARPGWAALIGDHGPDQKHAIASDVAAEGRQTLRSSAISRTTYDGADEGHLPG